MTPLQTKIMELHDQGLSIHYIWKTGVATHATIRRTVYKFKGRDTNAGPKGNFRSTPR